VTENPFGVKDADALFDKARTGFVGIADCIDRLIIVFPLEIRSAKGNDGTDYQKCVADVVILDGEPSEAFESLPATVDGMHISNGTTVDKCKANLRKGEGKPILGRVAESPSKYNRKVMAQYLVAPTDEDVMLAAAYLKAHPRKVDNPFDTD
jgi:hypothetical protein